MDNQLKVSIGAYSSQGRKELNQDFHDVYIPQGDALTNKGIAIALADGISSSEVSQIASKTSVSSFLLDYFSTPDSWSVKKSAQRVISSINSWLYAQSKRGKYHYDKDRGYVCTFTAMILRSTTAYIFHLGDSRIYRLRAGVLEQLTEDHRLWVSEDKSYLSRALGIDSELKFDYDTLQVEEDDMYLFMTDGIYEYVTNESLIDILDAYKEDYEAAAKAIVDKAYELGSNDNLTVQIIGVNDLPDKNLKELHKQLREKPLPPMLNARMEFDGFTIIRELSASSRSHVYLAVDNSTDTSVVIKTPSIDLQDDKAYLERFLMEEWIAKRISSEHLVKSYEQSHKKNYLYIVTEYIEGQTLTQWMIDNPAPSLEVVRDIAGQIAKGLLAFHRQEMIHQDLRPENIMIDRTGSVKIIDYGSTRVEGIMDINTLMSQEHLLGTAQYSAPEYFLGEAGSSRSDIFSLAVIVYQMISGKFPYGVSVARSSTRAAQKKLTYSYLDNETKEIPIWIDEALKKGLAPDPFYRYSELSEFIYDLRHPNREFVLKTRPPLLERNPAAFWKWVALLLASLHVVLLMQQ